MKKRMISLALVFMFCFALCTTASAATVIPSDEETMLNKISSVMQKEYSEDEVVWYVAYDANGNDISSYFNNLSANTAVSTANSLSIVPDNIQKFVRVTEYTSTRGSDIAKTHVEDVVEERSATIANARVDVTVDYTVTGTIYYDPNTYVVSDTLGPTRSAITFSSPSLITGTVNFASTNVIKDVDIDTYSATFYHCNTIIGRRTDGESNYDFGEFEVEFTVYAE